MTSGLRVIAGRLKGRRLRVPGGGVRPTGDRVREALFGRLGNLDGARVLDLYAGSGALGVEAISRGAARAVFVERAPRCLAVLRANLRELGLEEVSRVVPGEAVRALRRLGRAGERFDLVLLDPPYAGGEAARALRALAASGVLADRAMVVLERGRRQPLAPVEGLESLDERRYGDTVITRLAPHPAGEPEAGGRGSP